MMDKIVFKFNDNYQTQPRAIDHCKYTNIKNKTGFFRLLNEQQLKWFLVRYMIINKLTINYWKNI